MKGLARWLTILVCLSALWLQPALMLATNLLTNGGFTTFSSRPGSSSDKVATGWTHFYVESGTREDKLHWYSSTDFTARFNPGGDPYELEGANGSAQVIWSAYEFDAGIYQRVTGLTPGGVYAFDVPFTTFWRGSGYPDSDGVMKKSVGIDPTGGTDPTAPGVIWSQVDADDKKWVYMELAARAEASAMTFFVRIQAPENTSSNHVDLDIVYIDGAKVDLAPTVTLNVPATSNANISFSWTGSAAPGWDLKGVEVQYRDQASAQWQTVQGKTGNGNANHSFTGQLGHAYLVRARPWQTMIETYNADIDMPGLWTQKSVTVSGVFAGYARNNFGGAIAGALVSGAGSSATSELDGFYALKPAAYGQNYALTASASGYKSPPPITQKVVDENSTTSITFTLKPVNDAIANGDFESNTSGWNVTGSAAIVSGERRSGDASLRLSGDASLAQTVTAADVYNPTLSFWYKPTLSGNDTFQVVLAGDTQSISRTFTAAALDTWQHAWLPLGQQDLYSGSLQATFNLTGGQVRLDEVSLGNGPRTTFLPVIMSSAVP